jgi:hypothetical protein
MTTTEANTNMDTFDDTENGMRQRTAGKHPSALSSANKALSVISQMYDVDGDGELDASEQAMRNMDTDNRGYLTNEKVYKVMLEQMKLQREVFGLKRMSLVFVAVIFFLSLSTLGTSFAAASLAKDTNVKNGILVVKGGDGGVVGTSNAATTFIVTEGTPAGRRLAVEGDAASGFITTSATATTITKADAVQVHGLCAAGTSVFLKRSCNRSVGPPTTIDVLICPSTESTTGGTYAHTAADGTLIVTIACDSTAADCALTFATGTPDCADNAPVDLGTAKNYAILTKAGITTVPSSVITGDIGVSPITDAAMTGFSFTIDSDSFGQFATSTQIVAPGKAFAENYGADVKLALATAVSNMETAYTNAAGRTAGTGDKLNYLGGNLEDVTLTPGVYTFGTNVNLNGDIYFRGNADDIFIIQITSALIQAAGKNVILAGGAQAKNIFWQVAGAVTVGAGAHMEGTILAATSVTFVTGSSINGRVLAQTNCALQSATINSAVCAADLC